MQGFTVYPIDTAASPVPAYSRRDLYTVCLLTGFRQVLYADQEAELASTCLFFGSPHGAGLPAGAAARHTGYACRFTEAFFKADGQALSWAQRRLLHGPAPRAFALRAEQAAYLTSLFEQMLAEQQTAYVYKHELLRAYLQLVVHEGLRLRTPPPKRFFRCYFPQPGPPGKLGVGWRGRRRPG